MVIMRVLFVLLAACLCCLQALPLDNEDGHYMNSFLVELHKRETAADVARDYGFEIEDDLKELGYIVLKHKDVSHRSKRSAEDYVNKLKSDYRVKFANQEKELIRVKREIIHDKQIELPFERIMDNSIYYRVPVSRIMRKDGIPNPTMKFTDPFYKDQWYCHNDGQTGGDVDVDLNVVTAWQNGYTGVNVNICILDDGIDHTHDDIKDNYRSDLSTDLNDKGDNDPMPDTSNRDNSHGTRCAGEIVAKANNDVCGVGIAYDASIGGVRILDGPITDSLEGKALNFKNQDVHIYSASWGPRDDGSTMEAPGEATVKAIQRGVKEGRGGKGNIFVWASGNGGGNDDDCNCDGYVGMRETISIGSITDKGMVPYFMEKCPSTFAVVPSGGEEHVGDDNGKNKIRVVTTDLQNGCTENFEGTSAAAPLASGCIALVLNANDNLTWRDVQHIIAKGSRIPAVTDDWVVNGGGFHRSNKFGFGVMDCSLMVQLALTWENVKPEKICESPSQDINKDVPAKGCITETIDMASCQTDPNTHIERIESTQLYIEVDAQRRGEVSISLTSPHGTLSEMLSTRTGDNSAEGIKFKFMSLNNWGENIVGAEKWKVEVCDNSKLETNNVRFNSYKLMVTGTSDSPNKRSTDSFQPSKAAVAEMKELELKRGKRLNMKRNTDNVKKSDQSKKENDKNVEENEQQNPLTDVIHEISSYLQKKGFKEDHIIEILNHAMASSSKVKKDHKSSRDGLSRRTFGEEDIDHDKFIDGMSRAVGRIFEDRENEKLMNEKEEKAMEEKKRIEILRERLIQAEDKKLEKKKQEKERLENESREKLKERIMQERERQRKELAEKEKEKREEIAAEYIERFLEKGHQTSAKEMDRVLQNVRKILESRK